MGGLKEALLFEKRSKNFFYGAAQLVAQDTRRGRSSNKSFLVLFFKKELLVLPGFVMPTATHHSVMTRSAHSTNDTNIVGLPNFAPHWARSLSVTPRAREQAPQAKI